MTDAEGGSARRVWTDADFEAMGWHDCAVHAVAFRPARFEFLLDLDYILEWVAPVAPETYLSFWVAPATLAFHGVEDVRIELAPQPGALPDLAAITRADPRPTPGGRATEWTWGLEGHEGHIRFRATGYTQYLRAAPRLTNAQELTDEERGGFSFELPPEAT